MENEKSLADLVKEFNNNLEDVKVYEPKDVPEEIKISVEGVSSINGINFLYSSGVSNLLEKLFSLIAKGDFTKISEMTDKINPIMDKYKFGEGKYTGKISKAIITSIKNSLNSEKFNKSKSDLRKGLIVLKNLNKKAKEFSGDKELQKKFNDAVYAIKKIVIFANKIIKNRKIINKKVVSGFKSLITEDNEYDERLEKIEI